MIKWANKLQHKTNILRRNFEDRSIEAIEKLETVKYNFGEKHEIQVFTDLVQLHQVNLFCFRNSHKYVAY